MSKYFDETQKLNSLPVALGFALRRGAEGPTSSRDFAIDLGKGQRTSIVVSRALRQEFTDVMTKERFKNLFECFGRA